MADEYDGLTLGDKFSEKEFEESGQVNSKAIGKLYSSIPTGATAGDGTPEFELKLAEEPIFDRSNTTIDKVNRLTHEGKVFFVPHVFENVSGGDTVYLRHRGATTKYLNSILTITTAGDWTFTSYAGTTYTDDGTVIEPIKRKSDSTETLETIFTHTPTIDTLGTARLVQRFGFGTNPVSTSTSNVTEPLESIFSPGTDVLIELTNNNSPGGDYYLSARFDVYEDDE